MNIMQSKFISICFLFILFFPGKVYSDSSWWNYFDYAGASWNIEEFKTRASGRNTLSNFTPGLNDGVDVGTENTIDIFWVKNSIKLREK
jgi:hypothetical protein